MAAMKSDTMSLAFKTLKQALKSCLNISDNDIIIDNCSLSINNIVCSNTSKPAFYLIIDHNNRKIVLSIRGTASVSDVITDLNANAKRIGSNNAWFQSMNIDKHEEYGFVHEGILDAAEWIDRKSLQHWLNYAINIRIIQ